MAHRKEEYTANGHDVTIQQVRGPDSDHGASDPSAWIDGRAAYFDNAAEVVTDTSVVTDVPLSLSEKVSRLLESDEKWKAMETLIGWMCDNDVYFCSRCYNFYPSDDYASTGFAGHICGECDRERKTCPDNPDGDGHDDECLNPRKKHNARVPTKYRCVHCGRKRQTVPTG